MILNTLKKMPLSLQILVAMVLGIFGGLYLGAESKPLAEIGKIIIQLIKIAAIPLLFFTIIRAIITSHVQFKDAKRMIGFAIFNACVALTIGLIFSNIFKPGSHLMLEGIQAADKIPEMNKLDWLATIKSYLPTSILSPFTENAVIPLVVLAILVATSIRAVKIEKEVNTESLEQLIDVLLKLTEKILYWIIHLIPIAVFFVAAYAVGQYGFTPFKGLLIYVLVGLGGMTFHVLFTYQLWLKFYVRMPLKKFWSAAWEPVTYALGTNSSLATLPVTLKALKKLNISERASSLGACVGTNLNNDGIILYEAMAVLFIAQAHGLDLSLTEQIYAALLCLVASIGVAGIPEAGFVSLSIVLVTVGMPIELLPLLLTVDWIVARGRSAANALSDMIVSILIDRSLAKK
jgi:Na+/H+-dicarboxylate symporter